MGSETRKKTTLVMVRVTPDEFERIQALADTCSMSVPALMRQLALGYIPKSSIDAQHRSNVAKLAGDLGRVGGLLKLWLSTENIKNQAFSLEIPVIINELKSVQKSIIKEYEKLQS